MLEYEWPGNVRELENAIQHMVALNSGPALQLHDLPSSILNSRLGARMEACAAAAAIGPAPMSPVPLAAPVAVDGGVAVANEAPRPPVLPLIEIERRAIMHALEYTRGDRAVAAHLLGIGRTTLYRKLKEYNLAV